MNSVLESVALLIATDLEDGGSLTVLWTVGIDYVQGDFLQCPSPTMDQE